MARYIECLYYSTALGFQFEYNEHDGSIVILSVDSSCYVNDNFQLENLARRIVQRRRSSRALSAVIENSQLAQSYIEPTTTSSEHSDWSSPPGVPPPPPPVPSSVDVALAAPPPPPPPIPAESYIEQTQTYDTMPADQLADIDIPPMLSPPPAPKPFVDDIKACDGAAWKVLPDSFPPVGSKVLVVNGVNISGLDVAFQRALLQQKTRPLLIVFSIPETNDATPITSQLIPGEEIPSLSQVNQEGDKQIQPLEDVRLSTDSNIQPSSPTLAPSQAIESTLSRSTVAKKHISWDRFLQVFESSKVCKPIIKKIQGLLKDYRECDWQAAQREGTGLPQQTIISLYRYIEQSIIDKVAFHSSPTQSSSPTTTQTSSLESSSIQLSDEELDDLRDHIEHYVLKDILDHTVTKVVPLFVAKSIPFIDYNERYQPVDELSAQSWEYPKLLTLAQKSAFLRFVTLETLGLKDDSSAQSEPLQLMAATAARTTYHHEHRNDPRYIARLKTQVGYREEWRILTKGLSRALSFTLPREILCKLSSTMRMLSHCVDCYLHCRAAVFTRVHCYKCQQLHMVFEEDLEHASFHDDEEDDDAGSLTSSQSDQDRPRSSPVAATMISKPMRTCAISITENHQASDEAKVEGSAFARVYSNDAAAGRSQMGTTDRSQVLSLGTAGGGDLSADELMPAMIWTLVNVYAPDLETCMWLCNELRHPDRLHGEEGYALAQLQSAIEFIKNADAQSLEISQLDFQRELRRFHCVTKAMDACRRGHLIDLKNWLMKAGPPTIANTLSIDQTDSLLSIAIQKKYTDIVRYLLSLGPDLIDVDVALSPCRDVLLTLSSSGDDDYDLNSNPQLPQLQLQNITPLFYAVASMQLEVVVLLLRYGADRYHVDDMGVTALSIAQQLPVHLTAAKALNPSTRHLAETTKQSIIDALLADPRRMDLVQCISQRNMQGLRGLMLQEVNINEMFDRDTLTPLHVAATNFTTNVWVPVDDGSAGDRSRNASMSGYGSSDRPSVDVLNVMSLSDAMADVTTSVDLNAASLLRGLDEESIIGLQILRKLLEVSNIEIDQRNCRGETALLYLVKHGCVTPTYAILVSAALLLRAGADRTIPDLLNMTALKWLESSVIKNQRKSEKFRSMSDNRTSFRDSMAVRSSVVNGPQLGSGGVASGVTRQLSLSLSTAGNSPVALGGLSLGYGPSSSGGIGGMTSACMTIPELADAVGLTSSNAFDESASHGSQPSKPTAVDTIDLFNYYKIVRPHLVSFLASKLRDPRLDLYELIFYSPQKHALYELARKRNMNGVISLLRQGVYINIQDPAYHYNALIPAVCNQDYPMVELLLQAHELFKEFHLDPDHDIVAIDVNTPDAEGLRPLHHAAQLGDASLVGRLLQAGANRFLKTNQGRTAIDLAMQQGHPEIATILKFDPKTVSLSMAASHGDWKVVKALLNQGVDVNILESHESVKGEPRHELATPLIAAVASDEMTIVKNLLAGCEGSFDINRANALGMTPLMYAASQGNEAMVLKLLRSKADRSLKDNAGLTAADWAARGRYDSLQRLLLNDPSKIFVHDLIRDGDYVAVLGMFRQGSNPNQQRYFARPLEQILIASGKQQQYQEEGHFKIGNAKELPPFIPGETPLIVASIYKKVDVMQLLLRAPEIKINLPDAQGWTPLFHAMNSGNEEGMLILLKAGASRRAQDLMGRTAVDIGMSKGYVQLCALVEADPQVVLVHDMCEAGKILLVIALIKQGCPVNTRDSRPSKMAQTLLMAACMGKQVNLVKQLLRYPEVVSGINSQDAMGRTALMIAVMQGALDISALLLKAGCDRNIQDNRKLTAKEHAARHSFTTMMKYMAQTTMR